jgi:hypothetical protein
MSEDIIRDGVIVRQARNLHENDGGVVDRRRYQQDYDLMQLRVGILESRIVALLEAVGDQGVVTAASRFPWVPMSTTSATFVTGVYYDTATGILSQTSRTARIMGLGDEISSTIDTADDCPTSGT